MKKNLILVTTNFIDKFGNGGQILTRALSDILKEEFNLYIITINHENNIPNIDEYNGIPVLSLVCNKQSKLKMNYLKLMNIVQLKPKFFADLELNDLEIKKLVDFCEHNKLQKSILLYNYIYTFKIANQLEKLLKIDKESKKFYIAQNVEYELIKFNSITSKINSSILKKFETNVINQYYIMALTEYDFKKLLELKNNNDKNLSLIQPIIKQNNKIRKPINDRILITTNLNWWPNINSLNWFFENVYPKIDKNFTIIITGKDNNNLLKNLANDNSNIKYEGFVSKERLDELYQTSEFIINPTIAGGGFQVKMLEALANNVPVISTRFSNHLGPMVSSSNDPEELAILINNKDYNKNVEDSYAKYYEINKTLLIKTLNQ
jgi:glycosyltransferase involved in cell wall biosynthesis